MKKFNIFLILIIILIGMSSVCFGAQFYDTLGTKYESPTEILYTLGIVDGTSEHVFSANRPVTRAEMAKLILSVYGLQKDVVGLSQGANNFKDVKKSAWYYDYVNVAADIKMVNGYADGTFKPNAQVSYSEAIAMIIRALGYTDISARPGESWDAPYIRKMNEIRLAKNVGYFKNSDGATRGDIAVMLFNMLNSESYVVIKSKSNIGLIKETASKKVINRYYPDFAIIDDDILKEIDVYRNKDDNDKEIAEYYISTNAVDGIKVLDPIPLKRIGAKLSGMYNIDKKVAIGLNFIYDEEFDEGATLELEELYKLEKNKRNVYSLGKSENYAYVYFRDDEKIDRVVYLGSNRNILVEEIKLNKAQKDEDDNTTSIETVLINEMDEIPTSKTLINKEGELLNWSNVKEEGVLSLLENGIYVYNDKKVKGELEEVKEIDGILCLTIDGNLYACDEEVTYKLYGSETVKKGTKKALAAYVGRDVELSVTYSNEVMQINLDRNYKNASETIRFGVVALQRDFEDKNSMPLRIATPNGKKMLDVSKEVLSKSVEEGTIIHFEYSGSKIEFVDIFEEGLKIPGGTIDMKLEEKERIYEDGKLGKYELDENTVIYIVEKEYRVNSDQFIDDYNMHVEDDRSVLEDLGKLPVHVVYDKNNIAVAIFIEKDANVYKYKYAKVVDIYQTRNDDEKAKEKYILKIKLSPFNNVIVEYEISGNINCEPGDLISYTTDDGKLMIKERYNAKLLGDKRDYIVEKVEKDIVYLTNGDKIDLTKNNFEIDGEKFAFDKYVVVSARVYKMDGEWKFYSTNIVKPKELRIKVGDRIAMDEIEDLFLVYSGYDA